MFKAGVTWHADTNLHSIGSYRNFKRLFGVFIVLQHLCMNMSIHFSLKYDRKPVLNGIQTISITHCFFFFKKKMKA